MNKKDCSNLDVYYSNIVYRKKKEEIEPFISSTSLQMLNASDVVEASLHSSAYAGDTPDPVFSLHHSSEMIDKQHTVKIGLHGQKPIDVFFRASASGEMSEQLETVDEVFRTFQCVKCGAVNEEVPCQYGIMKCQNCGNSRKNIENESYFAEHSPDYLLNCLDSDDKAFNFKESLKFNTLKHAERLGTMDVDVTKVRPYDWVTVKYSKTPCPTESDVAPSRKIRTQSLPIRDKVTDSILKMVDSQRVIKDEALAINVQKRNARLVKMLQSDNPKTTYKPVQINSWKKILRENRTVLDMIDYKFDPENPPLSPKELGNWTWAFRSIVTTEGKLQAFLRIVPKQLSPENIIEMGDEIIIQYSDYKYVPKDLPTRMYYNPLSPIFTEILYEEEGVLPTPREYSPKTSDQMWKEWLAKQEEIAVTHS